MFCIRAVYWHQTKSTSNNYEYFNNSYGKSSLIVYLFVLLKKLSISKIKEPKERCHLYFLTSWFNSVVGERLRYTPLGWSKKYEFNESDFKCALDTIDAWVDLYSRV